MLESLGQHSLLHRGKCRRLRRRRLRQLDWRTRQDKPRVVGEDVKASKAHAIFELNADLSFWWKQGARLFLGERLKTGAGEFFSHGSYRSRSKNACNLLDTGTDLKRD